MRLCSVSIIQIPAQLTQLTFRSLTLPRSALSLLSILTAVFSPSGIPFAPTSCWIAQHGMSAMSMARLLSLPCATITPLSLNSSPLMPMSGATPARPPMLLPQLSSSSTPMSSALPTMALTGAPPPLAANTFLTRKLFAPLL